MLRVGLVILNNSKMLELDRLFKNIRLTLNYSFFYLAYIKSKI